jgi:hypothetical protein
MLSREKPTRHACPPARLAVSGRTRMFVAVGGDTPTLAAKRKRSDPSATSRLNGGYWDALSPPAAPVEPELQKRESGRSRKPTAIGKVFAPARCAALPCARDSLTAPSAGRTHVSTRRCSLFGRPPGLLARRAAADDANDPKFARRRKCSVPRSRCASQPLQLSTRCAGSRAVERSVGR